MLEQLSNELATFVYMAYQGDESSPLNSDTSGELELSHALEAK